MRLTKRQHLVLEVLRERRRGSVRELSRQFEAPEHRIRGDLARLEESGFVHCYPEGARVLFESLQDARMAQGHAEKVRIARTALECVQDGETLFLDSGLTVALFARELKAVRNLTIITNSPLVLDALGGEIDKRIILVGGEYSGVDQCCVGTVTEKELAGIWVSTVIMGADSIDVGTGAVFGRVKHFGYIETAIRNGKQTILLAESSKFDRIRGLKILDLAQVDTIVSDPGLERNAGVTPPDGDFDRDRGAAMTSRQQRIVEMLHQQESATVAELSRLFGLTEASIRLDLGHLESSGVVRRFRGGVRIGQSSSIDSRLGHRQLEKAAIARTALAHVQAGETLYLDFRIDGLAAREGTDASGRPQRRHELDPRLHLSGTRDGQEGNRRGGGVQLRRSVLLRPDDGT